MLVANMLNNLFTQQQIPQIGIMKAIGAGSVRIGRLYLVMTLLVAVAATLVALAPAILLGRGPHRASSWVCRHPLSRPPTAAISGTVPQVGVVRARSSRS